MRSVNERCKESNYFNKKMENRSTPPPLANVGLHTHRTVTETRNRRFKEPKKLVSCSPDDELFVSRPQFKKTNLADDQKIKEEEDENLVTDEKKIKQEGDENLVADDQEGPMEPIDPRLINFMMGKSSTKWLNHEFGDLNVDESLRDKTYDMGSFLDEYCPLLKTRLLPRRGWQMLRRSLGTARRFSQVFIELELKKKGLSPLCEPLLPKVEDSPFLEKGPLPFCDPLQLPKDSSFPKQFAHSSKLLESIMKVKKLLGAKRGALHEIALRNEVIEANMGSKTWRSSQHRKTKSLYRRCFSALYCLNDDIVAAMTVLQEHLVEYRKEAGKEEARACTPLEIYRKCLHKAELDLQLAKRYKSLQLQRPGTRDLVLKLQTILYIVGELGGPNSSDLLQLVDSLFSQLLHSLPPELSVQLKQSMDELEPYLQRMKDLFKNVPKEEPTEDIQ